MDEIEIATENGNSSNENIADDILLQVDSLFRTLETLPDSKKNAVLSKIKLQLGQKRRNSPLKRANKNQHDYTKKSPKAKTKSQNQIANKMKPHLVRLTTPTLPPDGSSCSLGKGIVKSCSVRMTRLDLDPHAVLNEEVELATKRNRLRTKKLPKESDFLSDNCMIEDNGASYVCEIFEVEDEEMLVDDPEYEPEKETSKKRGRPPKSLFDNLKPFCEICGKTFTQRSGLYTHMKRHNGDKPYECSLCDYRAVAKIDIIRHIPTHTGTKDFTCEICGKLFATEPRVKTHISNVHERSKKAICHICGFMTHSKDIMRRHNIVKHTEQERFECPICHEIVKQKGTFQIHMRRHTGLRPYSCPTCQKPFKSRSQLAAHNRTHKEGQHPCPECGHKFKTKNHLQRHIVIHTGAKPYSCHLCEYTCNVKGNITKHVRTVHHIADYTMRESQPRATDENSNDEAYKNGITVAQISLQEVSEKTGTAVTLEDLKMKEVEEKTKDQCNDSPKKNRKSKDSSKKNGITLLTAEQAVEEAIRSIVQSAQEESMVLEDANNNRMQADILSDAMKLLTSSNGNVVEKEVIVEPTENELIPQSVEISNDCNAVEVPLAISENCTEPYNMCVIQVIRNPVESNTYFYVNS